MTSQQRWLSLLGAVTLILMLWSIYRWIAAESAHARAVQAKNDAAVIHQYVKPIEGFRRMPTMTGVQTLTGTQVGPMLEVAASSSGINIDSRIQSIRPSAPQRIQFDGAEGLYKSVRTELVISDLSIKGIMRLLLRLEIIRSR